MIAIEEYINNKNELLDLSNLNLKSLSELPKFIKILKCNNNQITELPDKMPDSLQVIYCACNQITKLPDKLPNSLLRINCYENKLEELPLLLRINECKVYCDDSNDKFYVAATNLLERNIIKKKYKKIFYRLVACNKLFNLGFNDCSFIISQYI